jgi:signal transduction histidine kinase
MMIKTFRNDIMQVILNLIKNANDAFVEQGIKGGEIKVGIGKTKNGFEIEVSDNAGGIPENILDKIFDPYFSTKDDKNGTGLGLYMSKMIVEEHLGGKLEVETDSEGTSFIMHLRNMDLGVIDGN